MEKQKELEVLLVDDHRMMRDGLRSTINNQPNLTVIGEASNGEEAIILAEDNVPDVVVMDVNMPVMNGIDATKSIRSIIPTVTIIGLSLHEMPTVKERMLRAGASAYITKNEASDTLCATIRKEALSKWSSDDLPLPLAIALKKVPHWTHGCQ